MDVTPGPFKLCGWGWVDDVLWDQEQCGRYGFEINLLYAAAKGGSVESIRLLLEVSSFYSKYNSELWYFCQSKSFHTLYTIYIIYIH